VGINGVVFGKKPYMILKLAKVEIAVRKENALPFRTLKDMSWSASGGLKLSRGR